MSAVPSTARYHTPFAHIEKYPQNFVRLQDHCSGTAHTPTVLQASHYQPPFSCTELTMLNNAPSFRQHSLLQSRFSLAISRTGSRPVHTAVPSVPAVDQPATLAAPPFHPRQARVRALGHSAKSYVSSLPSGREHFQVSTHRGATNQQSHCGLIVRVRQRHNVAHSQMSLQTFFDGDLLVECKVD